MIERGSRGCSREHYVEMARNKKNPNKIRTHSSHPCTEKWRSRKGFWLVLTSSGATGRPLETTRAIRVPPRASIWAPVDMLLSKQKTKTKKKRREITQYKKGGGESV